MSSSPGATASAVRIDRKRESPSLDLWAERGIFGGYKVRVTLLSMLGSPEKRERVFFTPDRTGELVEVERWRRRPGSWLLLSVSGSF